MACVANKPRHRYGKSKVSISQVHALTMKSSWDPEERDVKIWNESSDSKTEFEPDLVDKEVSEA